MGKGKRSVWGYGGGAAEEQADNAQVLEGLLPGPGPIAVTLDGVSKEAGHAFAATVDAWAGLVAGADHAAQPYAWVLCADHMQKSGQAQECYGGTPPPRAGRLRAT